MASFNLPGDYVLLGEVFHKIAAAEAMKPLKRKKRLA